MKRSGILLAGKKILLILISFSAVALADFSRSSVGVVTDTKTSLQWQDDYSDNGGAVKEANWKDAIKYCNELQLDGGGWRLPNKNELLSIVDYTKYNPAIDDSENGFQNTTSGNYWSSTTSASDTSFAWFVNFYHGYSYHNYKSYNNYVRCVRSGQ
jgi:hypothetical protein